MKTTLAVLLLATSLTANAANAANAANGPFLDNATAFKSGNSLYADCTSTSPWEQGLCFGYIVAIADIANGLKNVNVCLPEGATMQEVIDVAKKYLTDHPAERHYSAYSVIIASFREAFPCSKAPPAAAPTH